MKLKGRTALVTGGSRGIGRAIALALAEEGADVAINYVSSEPAAKEVAERIHKLGRPRCWRKPTSATTPTRSAWRRTS